MRKSIIFTLAFLLALLLTLAIRAQSPQDYVVMRAWEHVRRGAVAYVYPSGLISYYSMDSRSVDDSTVYDTFGSNDATTSGGPLFGAAYGKYLHGVDLNGNGQSMESGYHADYAIGTNDFSFNMWINTDASTGDILARSRQNFLLYLYNGRAIFEVNSGSPAVILTPTVGSITAAGGWYCLQITRKNGLLSAWLDGVLTYSGSFTHSISQGATYGVSIGSRLLGSTVDSWDGQIDEVAIWNRALSSNEVSEIYNNGAGRFYTP